MCSVPPFATTITKLRISISRRIRVSARIKVRIRVRVSIRMSIRVYANDHTYREVRFTQAKGTFPTSKTLLALMAFTHIELALV